MAVNEVDRPTGETGGEAFRAGSDGSVPHPVHPVRSPFRESDVPNSGFSIKAPPSDTAQDVFVPQAVTEIGDTSSEQGTHRVQELRKLLYTSPSWSETAVTARTNSAHEFTQEEQEAFRECDRRSTERRAAAAAAVAEGVSPWRAHVEQNEQDEDRPYVIGYYRVDDKIKPLYGERYFDTYGGTNQVNLIKAEVRTVPEPTVLKGRGWDALPAALQDQFEQGRIFVTSGANLYDLDADTLETLSTQDAPDALEQHIVKSLDQAEEGSYLLHFSSASDPTKGRGAVFVELENGRVEPVLVVVDDKEYIVELKGCGVSTGGFPGGDAEEDHHLFYQGKASADQAEIELNRLELTGPGEPLPAASIVFEDQGYIVRLSPSTVRASFTGPDVYPKVEQTYKAHVISIYAEALARQIGSEHPFLLGDASHTENLLLWDDQFCWTDYSDHIALGDGAYPTYGRTTFASPFMLLQAYVRRISDVPGYNGKIDDALFKSALESAFAVRGKEVHIGPEDKKLAIATKLWEEGGLAYEVFRAKKEAGYIPVGPIDEVDMSLGDIYDDFEDDLDSEEAFVTRVAACEQEMLAATDTLREVSDESGKKRIDELSRKIQEDGILKSARLLDSMHMVLLSVHLEGEDHTKLRKAFGQVRLLATPFWKIDSFLEQELETIEAACISAPDQDQAQIAAAEEEVKGKIANIEDHRTPQGLYKLITREQSINELMALQTYTV